MKKYTITFFCMVFFALNALAQDYFDDLKGNGNPVSLNLTKDFNVSARLNLGDNSVKMNLFKIYRLSLKKKNEKAWEKLPVSDVKNQKAYHLINIPAPAPAAPEDFTNSALFAAGPSNFKLNDLGFGISVKGKTSDGISSLFSKGQVSPDIQFGFYGMYKKVKIENDIHKYTLVISPFLNFNYGAYQYIKTDTAYSYQTSDTVLRGQSYGISSFIKFYRKQKDQLIVGLSLTQSKLNNYNDLDKVEVKESVTKTDTTSPGVTRTVTTVNDNGYTYASGEVKQYWNTNLKCYLTYIPYQLDYRVAVILYPSVDFNNLYKNPIANLGLGIHFLEKDNPTISIAGIFFELNDMTNSKNSQLSFLKHSFRIGITTTLNVTSLIKK